MIVGTFVKNEIKDIFVEGVIPPYFSRFQNFETNT